MVMESLIGTKVWLNNDLELVKQVEQFAFKNGFGWLISNYNHNTSQYTYKQSFKPTTLKKIYALYFLENKQNLKFICYKLDYKKSINYEFTHKDRFDSYLNMNESYNCSKNLLLKEVSIQDLLKNENNWLWS